MTFSQPVVVPPPQSGRIPAEIRLRRGGAGTVLVVEDEPLMRLFVVRALQGAGYDTLEADSAERALLLLEREGDSICSLVADVRLPGASGFELAQRARELVPELPTLLMSGSGRHILVNERWIAPDSDVLQKPFRIADLLRKLEQQLGHRRCLSIAGS